MRCKHQNGDFAEIMYATHVREVVDGKMEPIGFNEIQEITGYTCHCTDCDRWWTMPTTHHRLKWLDKIGAQLAGDE